MPSYMATIFQSGSRKPWARGRVHPAFELLSIGFRNDWADEQRLGADPFDFASLMAAHGRW
jgi:hypothetical protein